MWEPVQVLGTRAEDLLSKGKMEKKFSYLACKPLATIKVFGSITIENRGSKWVASDGSQDRSAFKK